MLQLIGLVICVYTLTRMMQIPMEMSVFEMKWFGMRSRDRLRLVSFLSVLAFLAILFLTSGIMNPSHSSLGAP